MSRIRIANPQPGSAKYATASRADRYVRRKEAMIIDGKLHFLTPKEKWRMQTFLQTIAAFHPISGNVNGLNAQNRLAIYSI